MDLGNVLLDFIKNMSSNEKEGLSNSLKNYGTVKLEDKEENSFLKSAFGDKGVLQGIGSTLGGLGNLYMGIAGLRNAKKQQAFNNRASMYNMNNQAQIYNDTVDQRSQSHAASKGLQGQDRDKFINDQNAKSKLDKFYG